MSKASPPSYFIFLLLFLGLQNFTEARAQGIETEIAVDPLTRTATVSGRFREGFVNPNERNVVFRTSVIGNAELAERISELELEGSAGPIGAKRLVPGEYLADGAYLRWKYKVDLTPAGHKASAAHASWAGDGVGILMLDDLLPQFGNKKGGVGSHLKLTLPPGWTAVTADRPGLEGKFEIENIERSVIYIGKGLRRLPLSAKAGNRELVTAGEWLFSDADAVNMADEIFAEYVKLLGPPPTGKVVIGIFRFPGSETHGQWEAETRGRAVTIMTSDMAFRTQSLQRLHEQLRHEIFHLWIPNGLDLTGDYAWFYEGFALYESLKLGVRLNRIRFEDMLDTLARAHTIDSNSSPRRPLFNEPSLDPTVKYARGMIVAFLTDLALMRDTKGKSEASGLLRSMRGEGPATERILAVFGRTRYFDDHVFGSLPVDWTAELAAAGIESKLSGRSTLLSVAGKLNGRQKEILDRLGYNNWRKLGTKR